MAPINLTMKFVIIGDGAVGKTSLLYTYSNKGFPKKYTPTVMDQYKVFLPFNDDTIELEVWDTAGQENFGALRDLSYPDTDLFIICYSSIARASFNNIKPVWMKEVEKYKGVKFVLVGTKNDLIPQTREYEGEHAVIENDEAIKLVQKLEGNGAYQCSALLNSGVQEVFKRSVKVIYDARLEALSKDCFCTLI